MVDNRDKPMTVAKLILALKKWPQDSLVYTCGYEGGYEDCSNGVKIKVRRNVNVDWYYGAHDDDDNGQEGVLL